MQRPLMKANHRGHDRRDERD